jgi:hypothetical protein
VERHPVLLPMLVAALAIGGPSWSDPAQLVR